MSGGEQRRLQLLACLAARPNVLVLDEPTNDLDVETVEVLEQYLDEFSGVLVVVSHDRWFCDRVLSPPPLDEDDPDSFEARRSSLLVFEGGGAVSRFNGVYSDYFTALKAGGGNDLQGRAESVTGFASPPPLPVAPKPVAMPPPPPKPKPPPLPPPPKPTAAAGPAPPPPPPPKPKIVVDYEAAPSQRQKAKEIEAQAAAAKSKKKIKVSIKKLTLAP